jgi:hypothetical protein
VQRPLVGQDADLPQRMSLLASGLRGYGLRGL